MRANSFADMRYGSRRCVGAALVIVMLFTTVGALMLASVILWASNQKIVVARQNEYTLTQYVAEAGTEKIFAAIRNYLITNQQAPTLQTDLDAMSTGSSQVPSNTDAALFGSYTFITSGGVPNKIALNLTGSPSVQVIGSGTYAGLNALVTPYRIISRARRTTGPIQITTGIQRDVQIQQIPIFQFAIFYNLDMEIENGADMTVTGRVHANNNAYFAPSDTLTFSGNVTVAQNLYNNPIPGDLHQTSWIAPTYNAPVTQGVNPLNLPVGSGTPHDIIELPPSSGTDPIASQRLYNQAGLRIKVTSSGVTATDNSGSTVTLKSGVVNTTKTIYDNREGKTISLTEIDVNTLKSTPSQVPANGILYVADTRSNPENAVRIVNAGTLPAGGLSVASQNPIYIKGNYNTTDLPSAIFADAINILSGNWNDSNSTKSLSNRIATDTTVNAAFFTGIVPTVGNNYSGGVENFPRFLEDWSGETFTYKGSMVDMFASETATGKWVYGGNYYTAPNRNWSFDVQFLNSATLPPGTPSVRTIQKITWTSVN